MMVMRSCMMGKSASRNVSTSTLKSVTAQDECVKRHESDTSCLNNGSVRAPGLVDAQLDKPPVYEIDTAAHFYTDMETTDRDELIGWARAIAVKLKFAIVIGKSDNDNDIRKQYFRLDCERGGRYVSTNKKLKFDQTSTRKCGCPFRLRGYCNADKTWHLTIVNGIHNHELDKAVEGHLIVDRLKPEEKQFMDEMSRNLVLPKNIMSTLKEREI
ncbi:FAR1 DNA-binding domain protein [Trifolium pratense]|uniref:FAR1 DNA-binding domain protein n=1 Tax=Trifolium pratense TaxID=57577 RepID=A0A2K3NFZ3_TRIPR|nr:otubain [Trifolium pratense]PNY17636.1 FAR1 DNA-binding domain protein [Trifolium pratense]